MTKLSPASHDPINWIPLEWHQILVFICLMITASTSNSQIFQWAKSMGGSKSDVGRAVVADALGNIYTTGNFSGTADFDPGAGTFNLTSAGSSDVFISKSDPDGNFVWAKKIGGRSSDAGYSIAVDALGNVYTLGTFQDTVDFDPGPGTYNLSSAGISDIFISKLDADGNFVWAKKIGGPQFEYGYYLTLDAYSNLLMTGSFQDTVDFDPGAGIYNLMSAGGADVFILKLDVNGNFIWAKNFGGTSNDYGSAIALDTFGNIYTTGLYNGTADFDPGIGTYNLTSLGLSDIFISKLDVNGNFIWAKSLGGIYNDGGNSIALDAEGNIYSMGSFFETVDFDPGPGIFNLTAVGGADIYISKLNSDGNFIWAKSIGGVNNDNGYSIAVNASGTVYTTGSFQGAVDFDPGPGTYNLSSTGSADIFISRLNADGQFVWAKNMGKTSPDAGNSIFVDANDDLYFTGDYYSTVDFNPPDSFLLTSKGESDIFIAKYKSTLSATLNNHFENSMRIFPNPVCANFILDLGDELSDVDINLTNINGQSMSHYYFNHASKVNLQIEGNSGLYFLSVHSQNKSTTIKLLKQF